MANLDLYLLLSSSFALIMIFSFANRFFGGYPGREQVRGIEMVLHVPKDLRRRDARRFIDG
jgi:hypothetical protein